MNVKNLLHDKKEEKQEASYEKDFTFVKSLLENTDFDNEKIALLTNVSLEFVAKIAKESK